MIPPHMGTKDSLEWLQETLANRAELAYALRDMKGVSELSRAYAAGEAHAYGIAEDDVRVAEGGSDRQTDP